MCHGRNVYRQNVDKAPLDVNQLELGSPSPPWLNRVGLTPLISHLRLQTSEAPDSLSPWPYLSDNNPPLGFRSGRPFFPVTPLQVSPLFCL